MFWGDIVLPEDKLAALVGHGHLTPSGHLDYAISERFHAKTPSGLPCVSDGRLIEKWAVCLEVTSARTPGTALQETRPPGRLFGVSPGKRACDRLRVPCGRNIDSIRANVVPTSSLGDHPCGPSRTPQTSNQLHQPNRLCRTPLQQLTQLPGKSIRSSTPNFGRFASAIYFQTEFPTPSASYQKVPPENP